MDTRSQLMSLPGTFNIIMAHYRKGENTGTRRGIGFNFSWKEEITNLITAYWQSSFTPSRGSMIMEKRFYMIATRYILNQWKTEGTFPLLRFNYWMVWILLLHQVGKRDFKTFKWMCLFVFSIYIVVPLTDRNKKYEYY